MIYQDYKCSRGCCEIEVEEIRGSWRIYYNGEPMALTGLARMMGKEINTIRSRMYERKCLKAALQSRMTGTPSTDPELMARFLRQPRCV